MSSARMSGTSFGDQESIKPSTLTKCRDNALVDKGTKAPTSRLSLVDMRMLTAAAGGGLDAGFAYKTQRTIFLPQRHFWSFGKMILERNICTTVRQTFAKYNRFWHLEIVQPKSTQNQVFISGVDVQVICAAACSGRVG